METSHLLRLLGWFTGILVLSQVRSWSITLPQTVSAVVGSCVVVPCHTQSHSRVIWYRYHKIQYPVVYDSLRPHYVETHLRGRTSVPGKAAEGNCTLVINNVKREDNNLQVYVWVDPDTKTDQKFYDQTVTIVVDKTAPIISTSKNIVDGKIFQANCSINYSCPFFPPSLHWSRSPFLENFTLMAFNEKAHGQWMYTETLRGPATFEMQNSTLSCSAQFRRFTAESHDITLNISNEPVTVTVMPQKPGQNSSQYMPVLLPESSCHLTGDILKCVCHAEAYPHATIYWTVDGNDSLTSSFTFVSTNKTNVVSGEISVPAQSRPNISCTATNSLGSSTKQLTVDLSKTPLLLILLTTLMPLGFAVLFGSTLFIYRKYNRGRSHIDLDIVLEEQGHNSPQRSQDEDTQSSPCSPESNPEVDPLSCIYDNDCLAEMQQIRAQQHQNNATAHQREHALQPLAKVP